MALKVLVADDNEDMRFMLLTMFGQLGISGVAEASNGIDAFQRYSQGKFDLMTVDVNMPGMSGRELIREIRKQDQQQKILLISCHDSCLVSDLLGQVDGHIQKPFDIKMIERELIRLGLLRR